MGTLMLFMVFNLGSRDSSSVLAVVCPLLEILRFAQDDPRGRDPSWDPKVVRFGSTGTQDDLQASTPLFLLPCSQTYLTTLPKPRIGECGLETR